MHAWTFRAIVTLTVVTTSISTYGQDAKVFRAGAATSNVTPMLGGSLAGSMRDRSSQHIHDELHARCLVLDDGATKLAFAIIDSCMVSREIMDKAKALASEATDIPVENMLISASHSHSAATSTSCFQSDPDLAYQKFLVQRTADGIVRADSNLVPARIAWGSASLPEEVFNRRWFMKAGTIPADPFGNTNDTVKMNPPRASGDLVKPSGPVDPEIAFLYALSLDGAPIALMANYGLHYVGHTGPAHVSADYFGMFADRVQELLGADRQDPPFVGIMTNGTSGNINNIDFSKEAVSRKPYEKMRIVANRAADRVRHALENVAYKDWVPLSSAREEISLGVRKPNAEELVRAQELVDAAKGPQLNGLAEIYAGESLDLNEYPDAVDLILQSYRIGDWAIAAIPCEVFVEIGLEIKAKSPFKKTFTVSLANGYNGYLPTAEHHSYGGYETWRAKSSYLEVNAAERITGTILKLLGGLQTDPLG
jgi:hypothetical protein